MTKHETRLTKQAPMANDEVEIRWLVQVPKGMRVPLYQTTRHLLSLRTNNISLSAARLDHLAAQLPAQV